MDRDPRSTQDRRLMKTGYSLPRSAVLLALCAGCGGLVANRAALGEVTHIQLRNDGQKILFLNDFKQMRELDTQQALNGHVPARPLVEAPVTGPTPATERTAEAVRH